MLRGFGETGQAQSQEFSLRACVICRAPIRISFFLLIFFAYRLFYTLQNGFDTMLVLSVCGEQAILMLTVLCHEFGHGTMARAIGGDIDHILLWPFGGICFSSRPAGVTDPILVMRNELKVVAAGPSTHFLMTPVWAALLYGFSEAVRPSCSPEPCTSCSEAGCIWEFLKPLGASYSYYADSSGSPLMGKWAALLWQLLGVGIQLNVALFLFNVFFPMYPADGSKLLTTGLMYCCGVPARQAALVLVVCSSLCAAAFIGFTIWQMTTGFAAGNGAGAMMSGLMGWMGVMSLIESYRIYSLREAQKLHTHPLFQIARSGVVRQHDGAGWAYSVNQSAMDDEEGEVACCSGGCCTEHELLLEDDDQEPVDLGGQLSEQEMAVRRAQREQFLQRVEGQGRTPMR